MRVPQVKERVKESPASALRAMFAGIGSMLFVKDKIRHKAGTENSAPETEATAAPEDRCRARKRCCAGDGSGGDDRRSGGHDGAGDDRRTRGDPSAGSRCCAGDGRGETTAAPETTAEAAAALPLPNYDELTIASLRARLRTLTPEQLTVLIEYEKAHANRADVITMFERRITKLALGLTQSLPKVTE